MKRIYFYLTALLALSVISCSKDEINTVVYGEEIISASLEDDGAETRTLMNDLKVLWSAGDAISVFTEYDASYVNNIGNLVKGARTSNAHFSVTSQGTKTVAVYPYSQTTEFHNGLVTFVMPDKYSFTENVISGAPMACVFIPGSTEITFKNAGALLGVTVNNIPAGYNKAILSSSEQPLAGICNITFNTDNDPYITTTDKSDIKSIEIEFNPSVAVTKKTFYFPLPVGNYTNLEFSISNGTDTKTIKTKALNAVRGTRYRAEATLDELTGEFFIDVTGADAANEALANGENTISISLSGNDDASIVLQDKPASLTFGDFNNNVFIKGSSVKEVHLAAGSANGNFSIDLPQSTVTLKAGTFKKIDASTAENTLIIEKGVSIENLDIITGNVRVYGTVGTVKSSAQITVYVCEGGSVTSVDGNNITIVSENVPPQSKNNAYYVKTVEELKWIADFVNDGNTLDGWTVVLKNDIDLNNIQWTPIGYWQTFNGTFDGCDHTISNLKHHGTEEDCYVGLFGYTENATIKNLKIKNVDIKLKGNSSWAGGHMGALIGNIEGKTTVENIYITGDVKIDGDITKVGASRIGGVIGGNTATVILKNVHVEANQGSYVKGNNHVGGIAGQLQGEANFYDCSANIEVTANEFAAGGIVGTAPVKCTLTNCSSSGNISVIAASTDNNLYRVGGIAGSWADNLNQNLVLTGCSYTGTIQSKKADGTIATTFDCGGFVGRGYSAIEGAQVIVNGTTYKF